jgi:hypothetical protein
MEEVPDNAATREEPIRMGALHSSAEQANLLMREANRTSLQSINSLRRRRVRDYQITKKQNFTPAVFFWYV